MKKLLLSFLLLPGYQLHAADSHALQTDHQVQQTMTKFTGSNVTIERRKISGANYFVIKFQGTNKKIVLSEYIVEQCQALDLLFGNISSEHFSIPEAPEDTIYSLNLTPEGVQLLVDLFSNEPTINELNQALSNYNLNQLVDLFMAITTLGYKHPNAEVDIIEIIQEKVTALFFTAVHNHEIINPEILGKIQVSMLRDPLIQELFTRAEWQLLYTLQGHTDWVTSVAFSSDSQLLITASFDRTAKLWNAKTGQCVHTLQGHTGWVNSVAFSPDGRFIVTASTDNTAKLWDAQTGQCVHTLQDHTDNVKYAAFSPNGSSIVTTSWDHTAKLWDAQTGECTATLQGHTNSVTSAAFSRNGQSVATASNDSTARLWNTQTGECIHTLQGHTTARVYSVAFNRDGTLLATASNDKTAKIWDAQTGTCLNTLRGHTSYVESATFSPDGTLVVTASWDNTARLWDPLTGECTATLQGHTNFVNSAAFSPDGRFIVTASNDRTAKLWEVATGACVHTLQGHTKELKTVAFSLDGRLVVTLSEDNTAKLWRNNFTAKGMDTVEQALKLSILDVLNIYNTDEQPKSVSKVPAAQTKEAVVQEEDSYAPAGPADPIKPATKKSDTQKNSSSGNNDDDELSLEEILHILETEQILQAKKESSFAAAGPADPVTKPAIKKSDFLDAQEILDYDDNADGSGEDNPDYSEDDDADGD